MQKDNADIGRTLAARGCFATALLLAATLATAQAPKQVKVPSFNPAVLQSPNVSSEVSRTYSRPPSGLLSAQACDAMKQSVIATKVPPNASATAALETVMFMTKTELDMIDGGCATEPGITRAQVVAARTERQQQYDTAEQNCNAIQSGGRRCIPRTYSAQPNQQPHAAGRTANEQRGGEQWQQQVGSTTSMISNFAQSNESAAAASQEKVGQIVKRYNEEDALLANIIEKAKAARGNR